MKRFCLFIGLLLSYALTGKAQMQENSLTAEQKIAGLSALWSEAKYNEAFFDNIGAEKWDSAYLAFIRPVIDTPDDYAYYRQLQRFAALLRDGHFRVYYRKDPGIATRFDLFQWKLVPLEGKAIIGSISRRMKEEIPIGSEIVKVNGLPTIEYLQQNVLPYISSSTDYVRQDMAVERMFTSLEGATYRVQIKTPAGQLVEKEIKPEVRPGIQSDPMFPPEHPQRLIEMKWYPDGIAYVALNSFREEEIVDSFAVLLPELKKARKLILDLRRNGGGKSDVGEAIISYLTPDSVLYPTLWCTRVHNPAYWSWGGRYTVRDTIANPFRKKAYEVYHREYYEYGEPARIDIPADTPRLVLPTAILTGHATASAAENFLILTDGQKHIVKIGQRSNGSTGNPIRFAITEELGFQICSKKDLYPDGRPFVGCGVQPDIEVTPTVQDLIDGYDRTLQTALRYLTVPGADLP